MGPQDVFDKLWPAKVPVSVAEVIGRKAIPTSIMNDRLYDALENALRGYPSTIIVNSEWCEETGIDHRRTRTYPAGGWVYHFKTAEDAVKFKMFRTGL